MKKPIQLDLFADLPPEPEPAQPAPVVPVAPAKMSNAVLIAALPEASLAQVYALAAEAGRRRLPGAVPALIALCKRFAGFGFERVVPEQRAALQALFAIGGPGAAHAVTQLIARGVVAGPNLVTAVVAAAALGAKFDPDVALPLLRHENLVVRASACDCARAVGDVATTLIALLADRNEDVATSAACALGRAGRAEARVALKRWLNARPSARLIESLVAVADEDVVVRLNQLGRKRPDLTEAILSALDEIEHPKAPVAAAGLRAWLAKAGPRRSVT